MRFGQFALAFVAMIGSSVISAEPSRDTKDWFSSVRVGLPGVGFYSFKNPEQPQSFSFEEDDDGFLVRFALGGSLGRILSRENSTAWVSDFEVEIFKVWADSGAENRDRTDIKFTTGYANSSAFTPFVGVRLGELDNSSEVGYYVGSGIGSGFFRGSIAYAWNAVDTDGAAEFDTTGLSAALTLNPRSHSFRYFLKYQNFEGDGRRANVNTSSGFVEGDFGELFVVLGVEYTFLNRQW